MGEDCDEGLKETRARREQDATPRNMGNGQGDVDDDVVVVVELTFHVPLFGLDLLDERAVSIGSVGNCSRGR